MILRIVCPYPINEVVHPKTAESIDALEGCDLFDEIQVGRVQSATFGQSRSQVIKSVWDGQALTHKVDNRLYQQLDNYDYLLCVGSGVEFNEDDLVALFEHRLPIVSGAYRCGRNQNLYAAGKFIHGIEGLVAQSHFFRSESTGLVEADWVGAGFLLIRQPVLQAIAYPWFYASITDYVANGETHIEYVSEDVNFCINAREHGFKVFIDCDVEVFYHAHQ